MHGWQPYGLEGGGQVTRCWGAKHVPGVQLLPSALVCVPLRVLGPGLCLILVHGHNSTVVLTLLPSTVPKQTDQDANGP